MHRDPACLLLLYTRSPISPFLHSPIFKLNKMKVWNSIVKQLLASVSEAITTVIKFNCRLVVLVLIFILKEQVFPENISVLS